MQYRGYLSSIFYLTEAQKYLDGNLKEQNQNLINQLFRQGFEELNYIGFKLFSELHQHFPDLSFYSAKTSFTKQHIQFYINKEYTRYNCPFLRTGNIDDRYSIEERLFDGEVDILVNDYGSLDDDNPEDDYLNRRIQISFNKCKRFNQQDLDKLIEILNRLNNH